MAAAISDPAADLDQDGQTSVLEAFILASRNVGDFYEVAGRLATEHALLDDNGDGLGTSDDFFRGVRAVKKPAGGGAVDGLRANQIHLVISQLESQLSEEARAQRNDLERAVEKLRDEKTGMPESVYYERLENLMLSLARIYFPTNRP